MKERRKLTGKWYLSKHRFGKYKVKVEVEYSTWDDPSYGNGGVGQWHTITEWENARPTDLLELNIVVV